MKSLKMILWKIFFCTILVSVLPGVSLAYGESINTNNNKTNLVANKRASHSLLLSNNPSLTWNTFLGGSAYDEGDAIILDGSGNSYVTGYSDASWGIPIRPFSTAPDVFVAKLDSNGNLIWNTFLGGTGGDLGYGITVDTSGNIYVTGRSTADWGSPIRLYTTSIDDTFVAKLNTSGSLLWNTFLGGVGSDEATKITIGSNGNVFVTGRSDSTWGSPVRAYTADMDAFVANLDNSGALVWNSFLGGNAFEEAHGIAIDGSNNLYLTGYSSTTINANGSWGNPVRAYVAFRDAFLVKINSGGQLLWNTFLGGNGNDEGFGIALDRNGNAYISGYSTNSWENPIRPFSAAEDAFAAKVDVGGNLIWNTFLGGSASDQARGIGTDENGNIYITGYSSSSWGNPIRTFTAGNDAFATNIGTNGNFIWNTFLGGSGQDYGYDIHTDGSSNVYVTGLSNISWGSPIRTYTADMDVFVTKLNFSPPLVTATSLNAIMNPGPSNFTVTFSEGISDPAGNINTDDVTNPQNYLLINKGTNTAADTVSCVGGIASDDTHVTVTNVVYNPVTFTAQVTMAYALPLGQYRLLVCGTTSIVDLGGNPLAGDGINSGTDYVFDFAVTTFASSIPKTGFAPNRITSLPPQPTSLTYAKLGNIWLEIPSLKLKTNIVGVPQVNNTWDVSWLGNDAGWLNGTAFPTWEGNSAITAHVTDSNGLPGPFTNLKNLKYGDKIIVHLSGEQYIFEVRSSNLMRPFATKYAFEHLEGHSYLTLITCQGYDEQSDSYRFRRIVRAVLVGVK